MTVSGIIDELRERPENERIAIAGGVAGTVGVLLFVVWALTFFIGNGGADEGSANPAAAVQAASASASFEQLREELRTSSAQFETQYEQLRRSLDLEDIATEAIRESIPAVELTVGDNGELIVEEVLIEQGPLNGERQ